MLRVPGTCAELNTLIVTSVEKNRTIAFCERRHWLLDSRVNVRCGPAYRKAAYDTGPSMSEREERMFAGKPRLCAKHLIDLRDPEHQWLCSVRSPLVDRSVPATLRERQNDPVFLCGENQAKDSNILAGRH